MTTPRKNPAAVANTKNARVHETGRHESDEIAEWAQTYTPTIPYNTHAAPYHEAALSALLSGKNPAAVALGKLSGLVRSAAKAEASRKNGRKGGRPRKGQPETKP